MNKLLMTGLKSAAAAAVLVASIGSTAYANLITNGDFEASSYTVNHQFGDKNAVPVTRQGVTDWTGNDGYNLYFVAGTETTVSALAQYNTGNEMLYGPTAGVPSPNGGNFVGLDGEQTNGVQGGISQIISGLTPNAMYQVEFDWAAGQVQSRTGGTTSSLLVSMGNTQFSTDVEANASESFSGWFHASGMLKATGVNDVLSFLSVGTPNGLPPIALLDSVTMTQVPAPASFALLGLGLIGLGVFSRRRQRA